MQEHHKEFAELMEQIRHKIKHEIDDGNVIHYRDQEITISFNIQEGKKVRSYTINVQPDPNNELVSKIHKAMDEGLSRGFMLDRSKLS